MLVRCFGFWIALAALGCGSAGGAGGGGAGGGAPADAFVRVDVAGYPAAEPKRAIVLSANAAPDTAEVLDEHGAVVASLEPGADLGPWNDRYAHAFPVAFDSVTTPGTYRVRALGVTSPPFPIDAPAALYAPRLADAAFFYRVQRDGADVDSKALARAPSHLADASAFVYDRPAYSHDVLQGDLVKLGGPVDVEGGYFDAGDYVKFVETTSYVEAVWLVAMRDHRARVEAAGIDVEAKRGIDWLRKMWDDDTQTLQYQVGIGDGNAHVAGDHDAWRLPEADDALDVKPGDRRYYVKYRPVLRSGPPGAPVSPNLAGRLAADFALSAQVYRASNPSLADAYLVAGAHVFELADTSGGPLLTTSPHDYYPETSWRDDLELGAAELDLALVAAGGAPPSGVPHDA
ncbi:MAG TPA: glycoside hydrolase family 9 protein, partial [Minicystis sp.]|nr:glycoside hydrolase family 9 protein [Minicystis sp.]